MRDSGILTQESLQINERRKTGDIFLLDRGEPLDTDLRLLGEILDREAEPLAGLDSVPEVQLVWFDNVIVEPEPEEAAGTAVAPATAMPQSKPPTQPQPQAQTQPSSQTQAPPQSQQQSPAQPQAQERSPALPQAQEQSEPQSQLPPEAQPQPEAEPAPDPATPPPGEMP